MMVMFGLLLAGSAGSGRPSLVRGDDREPVGGRRKLSFLAGFRVSAFRHRWHLISIRNARSVVFQTHNLARAAWQPNCNQVSSALSSVT